jgi:RND family efflux transporter MFP subunit
LVEVVELREQPAADIATLIGVTEPWQEATLYFEEVKGVVSEVFVEEGNVVEKDAPVAQLVLRDYELELSKAQAELETAQAKLSLLLAGTRKEDIAAAEADNARARSLAEYWKGEWDRVAKLNAISISERAGVRAKYDAAVQEELVTRARWEKAVAGFRKEEIQEAQAQVGAGQQAVALAQRNLDKASLRAPFRGRVEQRFLDPGSYINQFPTGGAPVAKLVDLDPVDVLLDVSESLLAHCAEDAVLKVVSAVDPQVQGEARVISIGRVADRGSGTYTLRARMANPDQRFRGGMVVTVELASPSPRAALRIPLSAVCREYGQPPYVLLVERKTNEVVARPVRLGQVAGDSIQVESGLKPQDLLIVRGQDRVHPGEQVRHRPLAALARAAEG